MTRAVAAATVLAVLTVAAGCGGGHKATPDTTTRMTTQQVASQTTSAAALKASAKRTLQENYRAATYVLWHNALPAGARSSTRGPALTALKSAAAARRQRGVRVRMVSHRREIESLQLDPSYTKATAILIDHQQVQPSGLDGHALGKVVTLDERGRYELHRLGQTNRFVVWRVVELK